MPSYKINLSLPVTCDCGHAYKIDPVGVETWADLVCPKCHSTGHLDQEVIDQIVQDYMEAMGELYEDEEEYQAAMSVLIDAPTLANAKILDNGL